MNKSKQKAEIPEWMTKEKTTLIQKDPLKGTARTNYGPITCLLRMWKILSAQIRKNYNSLISRGIFPDEQKGCRKKTRGTEELLYINQHILNESKTRRKNLAMAWIDNKKLTIWSPKLDTTLSQNVWNTRPNRTVYREDLESRIVSRRTKFSRGKDPKKPIPKRYTITITICDSHDTTQPHP